jgi:hypothetical protein
MGKTLPDYAERFAIASLGLYGHNKLTSGDTSASGRFYSAVQASSDCIIAYEIELPINGNVSDTTVTGLAIPAGSTFVLGCAKNIAVTGGGTLIAQLISDS